MSTPNDGRQPDPQIWEGGSTTVLFNIISGSEYSEKTFRKYDLEITPGSSATGLLTVSGGISAEHRIKNYTGNSSTYLISNTGIESVVYTSPINDQGLFGFELTGTSVTKHIVVQTVTSTVNTINITKNDTLDERVGYSYNKDSLSSFSLDFFGNITISGSALVIDPPDIKTYSTGSSYRVIYNPSESTTSLLSSGEKEESIGYSYNQDSVRLLISENNGLITGSVTETDDSGLIADPVTGILDYEEIDITSTNIPFGTLNLNGSAVTEYNDLNFYSVSSIVKVVYSPDDTTGTLFNFGEKSESVVYNYNLSSENLLVIEDSGLITDSPTQVVDGGLINSPISEQDFYGDLYLTTSQTPFGSFNINGSAGVEYINTNFYDNITSSKVRVAYSPDDTTGTLFSFGDKSESVTYNYNLSSENLLVIEDSGLITDSPTQVVDGGLINSPISEQDFYGDLYLTTSQTPFGSFNINGSAGVEYINTNFYDNITSSKVRVAYSPDDTTGTLFSFGDKSESVTYNYNNDSILTFVVDNFGLVSNPSTETNDYGYVNESYSEQIDNGLDTGLGQNETITPFGNLSISGTSGTILRTYGQENTILFTIYGELNSPNIDYTPTISGIGTAYISGSSNNDFVRSSVVVIENIFVSETGIESRTHSYNENSIVLNVTPSYGLISESTTESGDDYGSIVGSNGETIELGFVSAGVQSAYPYGTIIISGTPLIYPEVDYTPKYTGTGLFNLSGAATHSETNSFGVGRRRGGNINLWGDALYSETDAYVGVGTILLDREGVVVPGLIARTRTYVGIETIILSSTSLLSEIDVYIGSGLISISGSVIEKTTSDTPDNTQLFSIYGELNHPDIDYTPHYGIEKNIGIGTTGIQITEQTSAVEKFVANTPENTQLFQIYGSGIESVRFNPPEDTELFVISGAAIESESESYVGVGGTLTLSDFGVEKNTESYVGVGTLQVSGIVDDSAQRTSRGVGSIFIVNGFSPQESYPWLPEPGVGRSWSFTRTTYIGQTALINISSGIALTHYYSPVYPRNALITDPSSGIGTIRINDDNELTLYRATLPYFGRGTIFLSGIGPESFTESTFVASGTLTFSGISSNREIAVYQDYVTGGVITISQQTDGIIEKNTEAYSGFGTILVSQLLVESNTDSYFGSGTILGLSGDSESYSAQTPEETVTITVSGSAQESFIAQTPEDTILYQFSGAATDEKFVKAYSGSGLVNVSGSATVTSASAHLAIGTIRFVKYTSDQNYDTCDSVDITSDNLYSAKVIFVANPPEDTVLFNIDGNAITSKTTLYTKVAVGLYTLSGTYQNIKLTHSESGIGTVFITSTSSQSERDVYTGSGSLFALSGRSESYSAQTPESTVILQISGSAVTSLESDYSSVGIGLFTFNGSSITSKITSYTQVGSGIITLSGQLVHPDIIFIPSPDGSGTINILGSSNNSLTKIYQTSGSLFQFASALESFTKSTYIGLGTIYIEQTYSIAINNPYQVPRVYVTII